MLSAGGLHTALDVNPVQSSGRVSGMCETITLQKTSAGNQPLREES
jgi:hypothetical protein